MMQVASPIWERSTDVCLIEKSLCIYISHKISLKMSFLKIKFPFKDTSFFSLLIS